MTDPADALAIPECNCSGVPSQVYASHCLQSIEVSEVAQSEALGHFFAASIWNFVRGEPDYSTGAAPCSFSYYKNTNVDTLLPMGEDGTPVVFFDCATAHSHRDVNCADVRGFDTDGVTELSIGSEADWLTFYWDVTNNPSAPEALDFGSLVDLYSATNAEPNRLALSDLATAADGAYGGAGLGKFVLSRGAVHGVD